MKRWKQTLELPRLLCPDSRSKPVLALPWERIQTYGDAFVTRWEIRNPSTFTFPIARDAAYSFSSVNWGDDSDPSGPYIHTANNPLNPLVHVYKNPGIYDISVSGRLLEKFSLFNDQSFRGVVHGGKLGYTITLLSMSTCKFITVMDNSDWTKSVQIMSNLFFACNTYNLPIGNWDVGSVIKMDGIFCATIKFNQNISEWNTKNVDTLALAFQGSAYNNPLNWDVSNVVDFTQTFQASFFDQPLAHWNVSSAKYMPAMFNNIRAPYNHPLTYWNVSKVTNFSEMFGFTSYNQSLEFWDVSLGENFSGMFNAARAFNQPIGKWNVSSAVNMNSMFALAYAFKQDLTSWNVNLVKDIEAMFLASNSNIPMWSMPALINLGQTVNSGNKTPLISATALKNLTSPLNSSSADYDNALIFYAAQTGMKSVNWNVSGASYTTAGSNARLSLQNNSGWVFSGEGNPW
jgi:hypothetical protein